MTTLGPDAAALLKQLRGAGGVRRDGAALRSAFVETFPEHATDADKDVRLARLLDELEHAGGLTQAKRQRGSTLPPSAQLVRDLLAGSRTPGRHLPVLHPDLGAARTATTGWTADEVATLKRLSRFLRDEPGAPVIARRERSFQLFGDEKRLDVLRGRRFGKLGLVDDERLRCVDTPLPFAWVRVGRRLAVQLLIVENSATFDSLALVLGARCDPPYDIVVWGGGGAIERTLPFAARLPEHAGTGPVSAISYYGDLDPTGVEIPVRADRVARTLGLPPVRPAIELYRALLNARAAPHTKRYSPYSEAALAWLPRDVASLAERLHARGHRVPQEAVDRHELARVLRSGAPVDPAITRPPL